MEFRNEYPTLCHSCTFVESFRTLWGIICGTKSLILPFRLFIITFPCFFLVFYLSLFFCFLNLGLSCIALSLHQPCSRRGFSTYMRTNKSWQASATIIHSNSSLDSKHEEGRNPATVTSTKLQFLVDLSHSLQL